MGTVSIFVCLHVGRGCVYSFACMRVGTFGGVYGCLFVYVYVSGRALDSTSLIISVDPTPPPCPAGGGCRRCVVVSRAGAGCSGERRPTLGGRLAGPGPTGLAGPRLGGGGPFGSPGPGPGLPWCGRLPVEPAGLPPRHPGASTLWLSEVTPSGSPLPFSGWRAAVVPAVVLLGVPCPGGPRMFGARIFSMPASCLAGWGCCSPHTLLNIYMEEPYEHKRDHTHRCTLKHSHWCKNRCSQTHIVLICCCFKTYFVILVRCAAQ